MTAILRILFLLASAAILSLGIAALPSFWPNAEFNGTLVPAHNVEVAPLKADPAIVLENDAHTATLEPEIDHSSELKQPEPVLVTLKPTAVVMQDETDAFAYPDHANDVPARSIHLITPDVPSDDALVCSEICLILIAANDLEWVRVTVGSGDTHLIKASREGCDLLLCLTPAEDTGEPADRTLEFSPEKQEGPGWGMFEPDMALRIYDRHGPFNANPAIMPGGPAGLLSRRLAAAGLNYLD